MQKFALLPLHKLQQNQYPKCILGLQLSENALSNVHQIASCIFWNTLSNVHQWNHVYSKILSKYLSVCRCFFLRFVALITCCFSYFHEMAVYDWIAVINLGCISNFLLTLYDVYIVIFKVRQLIGYVMRSPIYIHILLKFCSHILSI